MSTMDDLGARFRRLEYLDAPDLWNEAVGRAADAGSLCSLTEGGVSGALTGALWGGRPGSGRYRLAAGTGSQARRPTSAIPGLSLGIPANEWPILPPADGDWRDRRSKEFRHTGTPKEETHRPPGGGRCAGRRADAQFPVTLVRSLT